MATEIYTPAQESKVTSKVYTPATEDSLTISTGTALYEDPNKVLFLGDVQLVGRTPTIVVA